MLNSKLNFLTKVQRKIYLRKQIRNKPRLGAGCIVRGNVRTSHSVALGSILGVANISSKISKNLVFLEFLDLDVAEIYRHFCAVWISMNSAKKLNSCSNLRQLFSIPCTRNFGFGSFSLLHR